MLPMKKIHNTCGKLFQTFTTRSLKYSPRLHGAVVYRQLEGVTTGYGACGRHRQTSVCDCDVQKVCTPCSTYEERADKVKYRAARYEPAAALCQQVPDVWDRAQTRQMMDHVTGDPDYPPKINHTLPTPYVARQWCVADSAPRHVGLV